MLGRRRRSDGEVVIASEALVAGRYAEHLAEHGQPIPAWAWTNLLAHATVDELFGAVSSGGPRPLRRRGVWCSARAYLAGEVLDAADRHGSLRSLQTDTLVPHELRLMVGTGTDQLTPAEWVTGVLAALRRDRARHQPGPIE